MWFNCGHQSFTIDNIVRVMGVIYCKVNWNFGYNFLLHCKFLPLIEHTFHKQLIFQYMYCRSLFIVKIFSCIRGNMELSCWNFFAKYTVKLFLYTIKYKIFSLENLLYESYSCKAHQSMVYVYMDDLLWENQDYVHKIYSFTHLPLVYAV